MPCMVALSYKTHRLLSSMGMGCGVGKVFDAFKSISVTADAATLTKIRTTTIDEAVTASSAAVRHLRNYTSDGLADAARSEDTRGDQ